MTIAPRLFKAVGQLKGVSGIDCAFRGEDRAIAFESTHASAAHVSGLLMPMRRPEKPKSRDASTQLEHDGVEAQDVEAGELAGV
jgi:hypothetical protein